MKTIRDIADGLKVTAQSVRNELQRQGITTLQNKSGKGFVVSDVDAERIIKAFEDRRQGQTQKQKTSKNGDLSQSQSELLFALQRKNDEQAARIAEQAEQIKALTATVQEQAESVKALTLAIENTTESLKAAQLLHAKSIKQIEAEESDENRNDRGDAEQKKPPFWARLFKPGSRKGEP